MLSKDFVSFNDENWIDYQSNYDNLCVEALINQIIENIIEYEIEERINKEIVNKANVNSEYWWQQLPTIELEDKTRNYNLPQIELKEGPFINRVAHALSLNEGGFTSINANDAGSGISVGIRQWNQKKGELPTLLKAWHDCNPDKFNQIFGAYGDKLLDSHYVRTTNFWAQPGLMDDMKLALRDKQFMDVQARLMCAFVDNATKLGIKYGFKSQLGLAEVVDIANQKGLHGAELALKALGGAGIDERASIYELENVACRPNGQKRLAMLSKQFNCLS